jgi:hypothetical protein
MLPLWQLYVFEAPCARAVFVEAEAGAVVEAHDSGVIEPAVVDDGVDCVDDFACWGANLPWVIEPVVVDDGVDCVDDFTCWGANLPWVFDLDDVRAE